jgi:hypothetical protein
MNYRVEILRANLYVDKLTNNLHGYENICRFRFLMSFHNKHNIPIKNQLSKFLCLLHYVV